MIKFIPSFSACAAFFLLSVGVTPLANAANAVYIFSDLGTLGGNYSSANAINNADQVAGYSTTTGNAAQATVWNGATATDLSTLTAIGIGTLGGRTSGATAINNTGQVVGYSATTGGATHATLWSGGTTTDLGTLGGHYSAASSINNNNQVAGSSYTTVTDAYNNQVYHATLWTAGTAATITDLGTLGGNNSNAFAINKAGQVAGFSDTTVGSPDQHATLWSGGNITDLGTLGGHYSAATGINNAGQVAGYSTTAGDAAQYATLWNVNGKTITSLDTLGGQAFASAINNAGQVAGWSYTTGNPYDSHATLWNVNGTAATDLNSLLSSKAINAGWLLTSANGINDNGWIVGDAINNITGQQHGFLLSVATVPEPETYAMLLAGLGLLGFTAWRRKNLAA